MCVFDFCDYGLGLGKVLKWGICINKMVRAIMIVEMAGRPAEHLTEAIEKHIGVLNEVKDIEVHSIKVSVPREIEMTEGVSDGGEKMFTVFAEADFECDNFGRLSETMFDFMPSSVEVIEPLKISLDMNDATNLLNNISGRMHRYDEFAKIAHAKIQEMNAQLEMAGKILMERDKTIAELSGGGKRVAKKGAKKKVAKKKKVSKKK